MASLASPVGLGAGKDLYLENKAQSTLLNGQGPLGGKELSNTTYPGHPQLMFGLKTN